MPLLHIVEMTPLNQSYSAAMIFISVEKVDNIWALNKFKNTTLPLGKLPFCVVTVKEAALNNALEIISPGVPHSF